MNVFLSDFVQPSSFSFKFTCLDEFWNYKKVMNVDQLRIDLKRRLRSKKSKVVFVDGHPDAPYDKMVTLMDAVRDAGADKVGLASLKKPEDFLACTPTPAAPAAPVDGAPPAPAAGG